VTVARVQSSSPRCLVAEVVDDTVSVRSLVESMQSVRQSLGAGAAAA
jgi:hypothetical protein